MSAKSTATAAGTTPGDKSPPHARPGDESESELAQRFRLLADLSPNGILIRDNSLRCTYANAAWLRISGLSLMEALGTGAQRVIHPEDLRQVQASWDEADRTNSASAVRVRYVRPSGEVRWVDSRATPLRSAEGRHLGFLSTVQDITEARRVEGELADSERRYRLLFENMHSGFALHRIIVDAAGKPVDYEFLALNSAYTAMTGLGAEQVIGRTVRQLLPGTEDDPADWIGVFGEVALTGRTVHLENYSQAIHKWFDVIAYRPEPMQFAVVIRDVSERRRLEWSLIEASSREQRRLGQELHDGLGQELAGLALIASSFAKSAQKAALPNAAEFARVAELASETVATCRQISHGLSPVEDSRGGLSAALQTLVERHSEIQTPSVSYKYNGSAALQLRDGAADHLYRIAQEALNNALRHAYAKKVQIRVSVRRDRVRLEILDDGRGIPHSQAAGPGIGLRSMRHRASLIDAKLAITARPTGGTAVTCTVQQASGR